MISHLHKCSVDDLVYAFGKVVFGSAEVEKVDFRKKEKTCEDGRKASDTAGKFCGHITRLATQVQRSCDMVGASSVWTV